MNSTTTGPGCDDVSTVTRPSGKPFAHLSLYRREPSRALEDVSGPTIVIVPSGAIASAIEVEVRSFQPS